jgi:hypothetical protein
MSREPGVGQRLTELFWNAVQIRDSLVPGTPEHDEMARVTDHVARLMVDYDVRGETPTDDELDALTATGMLTGPERQPGVR